MSVCGLSSSFLFAIILTATTTTRADVSSILSSCDVNSDCPDHATCLHFVDRKQCACNEGYVAAFSLRVCETAVHLNQPCITRCAGFFMVCDPDAKLCVCQTKFVPAADGKNCVGKGKGLLGEACEAGCVFNLEQVCVDGVCRCKPNLRPMTKEEIRAWNNPQRQCINSTYSIDHSTASFTPTSQANHTEPPFQSNHEEPPSQANHTEPPDGDGAKTGELKSRELIIGLGVGLGSALLLAAIFASVIFIQRNRCIKKPDNGICSNPDPIQNGALESESISGDRIGVLHIGLGSASGTDENENAAPYDRVIENTPQSRNVRIGRNNEANNQGRATPHNNRLSVSPSFGAVERPEVPQTDLGTGSGTDVLTRDRLPLYINLTNGTGIYTHANTPDMSEANLYTTLT